MTSNNNLPAWQWVKETPVAIVEENELPMWSNADELVDVMRKMGAGFIRYPAIGWGAHFYDRSDFLPKYSLIDPARDLFGEVNDAMRKAGIKMMAYCHYGVLYRGLEESHPNWLATDFAGNPLSWIGNNYHRLACMCNEEFTAAMQSSIGEMVRKYSPDAVYLDGPTWYGPCRCDTCKKLYRNVHGEEMPPVISRADGSLAKLNVIRDQACIKIVEGIREEIGLDIPLLFNMTPHNLSEHRTGIPEQTSIFADGGNTTEVHRPGTLWEIAESVRMGESMKKVSMCYLPPGPYDTLRTYDSVEIDLFNALYAMHGGTPMLESPIGFLNDSTGAKGIARSVELLDKNRNIYYRTEPVKEMALLYSRETGNSIYADDASAHDECFSGTFQALLHGHRHFTCLYDSQLSDENLAGYRVVYLPAVSMLNNRQIEILKSFVNNGGSLIISGKTPLHELTGVEIIGSRPDDVYGAREYRETGPLHGFSRIPEAYLKFPDEKMIIVSDSVVGVPDLKRCIDYTIVQNKTAKVLADLYLPAGGAFGKPLEFPLGKPPAITINTYGKGKVIYVSPPIGRIYKRRRLKDIRNLIVRLTDIILDQKPLLKIDAPAGIIANVTSDGNTTYVHLLNYCGTMYECGNPVEEIVPVHDINVMLLCNNEYQNVKIKELKIFKTLQFKTNIN